MEKLLYGIPLYVLIPVAVVLLAAVLFLVLKAFNEGREVTFWPPRIGPRTKPDSVKENLVTPDPQHNTAGDGPAASSLPSVTLSADPIAALRIVSGPLVGRMFFLTEEHRSITVGRANICDISFPGSRYFSKTHFRIDIVPIDSEQTIGRDYNVKLVDCGSTNGTFVNGRKVTTKELRDNDRIQLGDTTIVFHRIHTSSTNDA